MSGQIPYLFPLRRRSHLKSETVRTLARVLSLCSDESQCSPAIQISLEAPRLGTGDGNLGLGIQKELCNDLVDPGGENSSIESTKAVGIHNGTSSHERIVTTQLDDRTRPEGYAYLGCREVSTPSNMSVEKDLIANSDVASINDQSEHLVSEQIVVKKSGIVGGIMEDREHSKLSSENAGVTGFPKGISELEQIMARESNYGTRLEGNKDIACGNDAHSHSNTRMEKDLAADIVVSSSDNDFNNSLMDQNEVVETGDVAGQVEYKANLELSIKNSEKFGVEDGASTPERRVTVGFGHRRALEGNGDLTFADIHKDTYMSLEKDLVANDVGGWIDNQNNDILCSERLDVEVLPQVPEVVGSEFLNSINMLENELIPEESMAVNNAKDEASLAHMMEKLEHEMQQKELDMKESASYKVIPDNSVSFVSDREIEEGEIPDDSGVSNRSVHSSSEDTAVAESMGVEGQIFWDAMKKEKFSDNCKDHNKGEYEDCVQAELNRRKRKGKEARSGILVRNENEKGNAPKEDINCPIAPTEGTQLHEEISDKIVTKTHPMTSKKKQDVEVYNKKRRGPSTEMKKKLKKKRKRAEKNKLLGVKRLKLHPILKPKPVKYCEHYLRGRCWQGDLCNFSHDTIPLTKSTPCTHFAHQSCLKGDDCPFDHELSKYPCNNYMSNGSCIRGDKCLFSHKILPEEGSCTSLNAGKPKFESSALQDNRNSRKQVNIDGSSGCTVDNLSKNTAVRVPFSTGTISHGKPERKVVEKRLKPLGQVPRGIRFLKNGNTSLDDSNGKQHGDLPSNGGNGTVVCNQKSKSAPDKHQNLNEMQRRVLPAVPPKEVSNASRNNSNFSTGNSQDEPMKASKILDEFLFGAGGNGDQ
ncbi:zinc finger CCCH domain-containing protein 7-like isoform X2 [Macadamia integrifolia]|uniref:zinc finger CCCH domain-containing protein 7-like isoform X2 n=1 Tax=Macadamia integrifolia TaxID=60698 RepID=UPI001C4F5234|nr:zinc finger CCCH domain-containing protein 7-like isoform X2 [Macadamia integrifolia]